MKCFHKCFETLNVIRSKSSSVFRLVVIHPLRKGVAPALGVVVKWYSKVSQNISHPSLVVIYLFLQFTDDFNRERVFVIGKTAAAMRTNSIWIMFVNHSSVFHQRRHRSTERQLQDACLGTCPNARPTHCFSSASLLWMNSDMLTSPSQSLASSQSLHPIPLTKSSAQSQSRSCKSPQPCASPCHSQTHPPSPRSFAR